MITDNQLVMFSIGKYIYNVNDRLYFDRYSNNSKFRTFLEGEIMVEHSYKSDLSIDEKVLMAIVRLAEKFKRSHSEVFRKYGLSFPQYNVLRVLEASDDGRNKISNVSRIMLVPGANITGIAKRLAKDGFIIKKPDPKDERVTVLEISLNGKRILKQIEREKNERLALIVKKFSKNEKMELLQKIKRILKNGMPAG